MGNGKKNKIGGAPKVKGRLAAALAKAQFNAQLRAKSASVAAHKEEQAKAAAAGSTQSQMKKQRKLARQAEKGKERAMDEANANAAAAAAIEGVEGDEAENEAVQVEGTGKRAREERERRKGTIPYKLGEKVLLVGEGNFSFAHSLLLLNPPVISPHLLLATSFDSLTVGLEKYPDLMLHVTAIREAGAKVVFGVDATDLKKCKEVKESGVWDRVAFNFPHVGAGISDQDRNVRANQTLILKFFRSVAPFLRKGTSSSTSLANPSKKKKVKRSKVDSDDEADRWDKPVPVEDEVELGEDDRNIALTVAPPPPTTAGTALVTLRTGAPYSLWTLNHLGTRGGLIAPSILPRPHPPGIQPTYLVVRSFEFSTADYPGYEHRRTIGFKEGVSSAANDDLTMSARQRGEKRREEKEEKDREEKEKRGSEDRKGAMRTVEFELVPEKDKDDLYDDL